MTFLTCLYTRTHTHLRPNYFLENLGQLVRLWHKNGNYSLWKGKFKNLNRRFLSHSQLKCKLQGLCNVGVFAPVSPTHKLDLPLIDM